MKSRFIIFSLCILTIISCRKQISQPVLNSGSLTEELSPMPPFLTNYWVHLSSPDQQGFGYKNCSFSINGKGYVILGIFDQLWEFDPATSVWTNKGTTPHSIYTSYSAVSFTIGAKGYYYTNDSKFWEYDPVTNAWTAKQDFPGVNRSHSVGFAVNGKGYIGSGFKQYPTGTDNTLNDFWEYNPATNQWVQKANTPGLKRGGAIGFGTSTKGYLGTGRSYFFFNGSYIGFFQNDWWEYNPITNAWTQKTNYPGQSRINIEGFVINDLLYMGIGSDASGNPPNDFYRYSPSTDQWIIRASPGETLSGEYTTGFAAGSSGYYVSGNLTSFWRYIK